MLLLPFECLCARHAVSFSECSFILCLKHLKMFFSDYVRKAENPCLLSFICLAEEGYSVASVGVLKFLCRYKETGSISRKPGMGCVTKITTASKQFSLVH